jgi:acetylornithine deacetylase/succinyl-diaminopimelate desuccinylase-like protein
MDIRTLPGQKTEMLVEALKKLIEKIGYEVRNTPRGNPEDIFVYFEVIRDAEASYWKNWENSKKLKYLYSLIEKIYDKRPFYSQLPAGSDAHYYRESDYCTKTLLFGAGNSSKSHTIDESIELDDFIKVIKVYTLFSFDYLKKP